MNICIRCGKQRVVTSTYDEVVSKSTVTYAVMECPDPECQKLVEKDLKSEELKRNMIKEDHSKRQQQRMAAKKASA